MSCTEMLKARVSPAIKSQVKTIVERELLTESAWLKRVVIREVRLSMSNSQIPIDGGTLLVEPAANESFGRQRPVYVRFPPDDRLLLESRAAARGLRPATYVSVLTRAHLRCLAPLPKEEYLALKRCIGELRAIGRNINQLARIANEGGKTPGSVREEFRAMLKICEALRSSIKALLKANETSWRTGHV
jgi:hypothetical protein